MSDLLSASSLLMAIAAILFSLWYAEIAKALEIKPKTHSEDNVAARIYVKNVFFSKALPVSIMAVSVSLIFIPDAIKLIKESLVIYQVYGFDAIEWYDAVKTAYCFVSLLSTVLALYMCKLAISLWMLGWQLR